MNENEPPYALTVHRTVHQTEMSTGQSPSYQITVVYSDPIGLAGGLNVVVCYNGKCGHDPTSSGSWYYDGQLLSLSYYGPSGVSFTVIKTSPTHIELRSDKGDIIHLMRGGTALKILPPAIAHAPQPDMARSNFYLRDIHTRRGVHVNNCECSGNLYKLWKIRFSPEGRGASISLIGMRYY